MSSAKKILPLRQTMSRNFNLERTIHKNECIYINILTYLVIKETTSCEFILSIKVIDLKLMISADRGVGGGSE